MRTFFSGSPLLKRGSAMRTLFSGSPLLKGEGLGERSAPRARFPAPHHAPPPNLPRAALAPSSSGGAPNGSRRASARGAAR